MHVGLMHVGLFVRVRNSKAITPIDLIFLHPWLGRIVRIGIRIRNQGFILKGFFTIVR